MNDATESAGQLMILLMCSTSHSKTQPYTNFAAASRALAACTSTPSAYTHTACGAAMCGSALATAIRTTTRLQRREINK
jgi:hypothetical protein